MPEQSAGRAIGRLKQLSVGSVWISSALAVAAVATWIAGLPTPVALSIAGGALCTLWASDIFGGMANERLEATSLPAWHGTPAERRQVLKPAVSVVRACSHALGRARGTARAQQRGRDGASPPL